MSTKHIKLKGLPTREELDFFWRKIHKFDENNDNFCWFWIGADGDNGYGKHRWRDILYQAHRIAYYFHYKQDPEDYQIDHICNNSMCCNPKHLIPATHQENMDRMLQSLREFGHKKYCFQGHELIEENIYRASNGKKMCLACREYKKTLELDFRKVLKSACKYGHKYPENYLPNSSPKCKICLKKLNAERREIKNEWRRQKRLKDRAGKKG